jgi:hypothetical protein
MEFKINIERKHLLYTVFLVAIVGGIGLGVAYNTDGSVFNTDSTGPMIMGHSPDEIFCNGCITGANIADDAITNVSIAPNANIAGSKIEAATLSGEAGNLNCSNADTVGGQAPDQLGGTKTTYELTVRSYIEGGIYKSYTAQKTCPGTSKVVYVSKSPVTSGWGSGADCSFSITNGNTVSIKAHPRGYYNCDHCCAGCDWYSDSCTPGGKYSTVCQTRSCTAQYTCDDLVKMVETGP